jgi:acyl-CoA synthetase (AMP-forming)/AMP-acid ligase II
MSELRTLRSLVDTLSEHDGDRLAVLALHKESIERWSYTELADHVRRLASGLSETGAGQGDHVALLAANWPERIAARRHRGTAATRHSLAFVAFSSCKCRR